MENMEYAFGVWVCCRAACATGARLDNHLLANIEKLKRHESESPDAPCNDTLGPTLSGWEDYIHSRQCRGDQWEQGPQLWHSLHHPH